jgi:hypothetical protein
MDAGEAAIIAAAVSSVVGGLIGFFSSYLSNRQAHYYQTEALRQEFVRDRISNILPLRQKALQTVWFTLVQARLYKTVTDSQIDEYIRLTIWLPESLRLSCIQALSHLNDEAFIASTQTELVNYIESLEEPLVKSKR